MTDPLTLIQLVVVFFDFLFLSSLYRSRSPPVPLMPATFQFFLVFFLTNMTRLGWLWKSCVWRWLMKSRVRRTRTPTTTLTMAPLISCQPLRLHSPRRFTWRVSRSREGRSKFGGVRPSRSQRQVILSGNSVMVSRSSHGLLFWPGVCWQLLSRPPHLSAFFLPLVTPWRRSGAVCHVIILRNACIYMRSGLKSASGLQIRRSSTWITSSFWPLVSEGSFLTFSLRRGVPL